MATEFKPGIGDSAPPFQSVPPPPVESAVLDGLSRKPFIMNPAILLVEDDENDVIFTTMALKKAGVVCPISVAPDGRQAIEYLSGEGQFSDRAKYPLPTLILLDLKLPMIMGLEVLKWIREREEFDATIVLVVTSSQQPEDMRTAYHLHANGYVVKPSGFEKLHPLALSIKEFWLNHNQVEPIF